MPLPANVLGLLLGGPTLMVWGTDEQKERYLPPILSAEEIWCQGFSEPDAGSDLASAEDARRSRTATSGSSPARRCGPAARSTRSGACSSRAPTATRAKHKGLTYFLMDMEQEAVQVRPLRQITGEAEFNELFIEEARIPDENLVGGVGNGWKVALTTLMNERAGLGFALQVRLRQLLDDLFVIAAGARAARRPAGRRRARRPAHPLARSIRLMAWKGLSDDRAVRPARAPRARW